MSYITDSVIKRKRGDTKQFRLQLRYEDGSLRDISEVGTTITLYIAAREEVVNQAAEDNVADVELKITGEMEIEDADKGIITFEPTQAEMDTAGVYLGIIKVIDSAGTESFPEEGYIELTIEEDIG